MIYEYRCLGCDQAFDVVKSANDFKRLEYCSICGAEAKYHFVPNAKALLKKSGMQESAEFNPGLGCIVKDKKHREELCKIKGVEEVGNEKPETLHKHFEDRRKEKIEKAYDDITKGWIGDGSS